MSTLAQVLQNVIYCKTHVCDEYSLGPAIVGLAWALLGVDTITVLCRLYVRCIRKTTPAGLDDVAIVIALAIAIASGVTTVLFSHRGIGTHIWLLKLPEIEHATKWTVIGILQSYLTLFFIRVSIAIFILRMLQKDNRSHQKIKLAVYFCLFLNFAATLMVCLVEGLWCVPLRGLWDLDVTAKCHSRAFISRGFRAFGGISAVTDLLYACLPIAILWPARMKWKVKRNLGIMMLFTLVISACAIGKAVTANETSPDFTWVNGQPAIWTVLEVTLGIVVANLPALRHFYILTRNDISHFQRKSSTRHLNAGERELSTDDRDSSGARKDAAWRLAYGHTTEESGTTRSDTLSVRQEMTLNEFELPWSSTHPPNDEEKVGSGPVGYTTSPVGAESSAVATTKSSR